MAYAYCAKCNSSLDHPSIRECLKREIECSSCGRIHDLCPDEAIGVILDLEDRISNIEKHLGL